MKKEKSKSKIIETEVRNIRDKMNEIDEILDSLDALVDENEPETIKDLDWFITKLKLEDLYTPELEKFIENYMKFYNR